MSKETAPFSEPEEKTDKKEKKRNVGTARCFVFHASLEFSHVQLALASFVTALDGKRRR